MENTPQDRAWLLLSLQPASNLPVCTENMSKTNQRYDKGVSKIMGSREKNAQFVKHFGFVVEASCGHKELGVCQCN